MLTKFMEVQSSSFARTITIEVDVFKGIGYNLVGLPDNAIKKVITESIRPSKYWL